MNMQALLKQAQKMQKELATKEAAINETVFESSMGGGAVKVALKGDYTVQSIEVDESLLEKDNKEDLQDLLVAAMNAVLEDATKAKEKMMGSVTGGIKMPGGF